MAVFEYLRISLARPPAPLFEASEMTRQEFLREAFSKRWDFPHQRKILIYDPIPDSGAIIGGVVGREIKEIKSEGPDDHWKPAVHRYWPHALLSFDIGEREQIAAFQNHARVGSPRAILKSLLDHISKQPPYSMWHPHVEYIATTEDFWVAAKEYAGRISSLNFSFVPPNMLRAKEAIDDLVRAATDEANSEETEWPAPGSEDTKLGVLMEPEVRHGAAEVYAGVQA